MSLCFHPWKIQGNEPPSKKKKKLLGRYRHLSLLYQLIERGAGSNSIEVASWGPAGPVQPADALSVEFL